MKHSGAHTVVSLIHTVKTLEFNSVIHSVKHSVVHTVFFPAGMWQKQGLVVIDDTDSISKVFLLLYKRNILILRAFLGF